MLQQGLAIHAPYVEAPDIETSSEDYARRFAGELGDYFLSLQAEVTLDLLSPWPTARVLDVGGGHAQIAVPLVRSGFDVTVLGSSEACRARLDRALDPGSFRFERCDLPTLAFEDRSFDVVLSFRLLSHMDQWQTLLAEMCRVAGEAIILDYPDTRSFNMASRLLFKAKKAVEGNTRPFACFKRKELVGALAGHAFGQPFFRPEFFVPMAVHRAIDKAWVSRSFERIARSMGLTYFFGSPVILRASRTRQPVTFRR